MERTDIYLEIVMANPILLAPIVGFIALFLLLSPDKRLSFCLLIIVPWLTVARSPGLGTISAAAKLSSGGAFLLLAYAAISHPSEKRDVPGILWLYPVVAFFWLFLILGVEERSVAVVLRLQWLLVTIGALALIRTITTYDDLMNVIKMLTFGCLIALILPISALVLYPEESFLRGLGRFQPWGANSNQIGMLFALSTPLIGYAMMTWERNALRPIFIFLLALIVGMALLTASRMTMLAIVMTTLPILLVVTKRPLMTVLGLGIAAAGLMWIMSMAEDTSMERLGSLESQRTELWGLYIRDVFAERPLTGLLGVTSESYFRSNVVGQHPHSAWFNMMYHGGILLFIPLSILVCYSTFSAYQVWKYRRELPGSPLFYSIIFMLLIAMYTQGCFNQVVYWPTYTWSFLHVVIAGLFICLWGEIREGNLNYVLRLYDSEEYEEEDFVDYSANASS